MASGKRLMTLVTYGRNALLMTIWLVFVMSMFFNWGQYIHPVTEGLRDSRVEQDTVSHVIYLSFAGCIILFFLSRPAIVLRVLFNAWPIMLLVLWIFLSVTWAPEPSPSFSTAVRFCLLIVLAAYMVSIFDLEQFVAFVTTGFAIAILASIAVFVVAPKLALSGNLAGYHSAWRGAFPHKNWLGAAMAIGVVTSAYSYAIRANSRLMSVATFLGCFALLILSRSATAMGAAAASALIAIFGGALQSTGRRAPLRVFALIGFLVISLLVLVFPLTGFELNDFPKLIGRSSNLTGRTEIWRAVWMIIRERPILGQGYGFWNPISDMRNDIWNSVNWAVPSAHNTWLDAWLQLGLVGLVITALIWLIAFFRSISLVYSKHRHGSLFFLAILVGCFAKSFTEEILFAPAITATFWLVTSYMYLANISKQRDAEKAQASVQIERAIQPKRRYVPQ